VLVDILKQDWPHKWPSFIPDIVGASKTNETLCENSMAILRLLSEEVFDFSKESLTAVGRGGSRGGGRVQGGRAGPGPPSLYASQATCPPRIPLPPWAHTSAA
jgi:hypothetical protein